MTGKSPGRFRKTAALALALFLALSCALPVWAAVPDRPENQYVLDEADVLSEETEQEIIGENQDLFQETGAQIVVVAVDFLDGEDIAGYTYDLFNTWGIGSQERNNGLLLVLAIGEDNYYAQAGYGIEDYFDGAKLQDMLDQYLEPDFAARDYDAGVDKFFQAALSDMESYYANYSDEYTDREAPAEDYYSYEPSFGERIGAFFSNLLGRIVTIVVIVLVVVCIFAVLRNMGGGGPRSGGGGGGGGFWSGLFLGNLLSRSRRRYGGWRPPPPPGGFGPRPPRGGGGFGGFRRGGSGGFGGAGRGGGGGFHGGGGSRGGGAGRR